MKITKTVLDTIETMRPELRNRLGEYSRDIDDVIQDVYIKLIEVTPLKGDDFAGFAKITARNYVNNYVRDQRNRRKLEEENAGEIVKNTTPTLSGTDAGGPEGFVASEQELVKRWRSLSSLLKRVAKRSFFGYTETVESIARTEGMTVAAVNMARTRIKQHMNGVNDARKA